MTTLRKPPISKLGISLQMYRADHPDEWSMDDFTRLAEKMQARIDELERVLNTTKDVIKTSPAVTDTIWMNDFTTLHDALDIVLSGDS